MVVNTTNFAFLLYNAASDWTISVVSFLSRAPIGCLLFRMSLTSAGIYWKDKRWPFVLYGSEEWLDTKEPHSLETLQSLLGSTTRNEIPNFRVVGHWDICGYVFAIYFFFRSALNRDHARFFHPKFFFTPYFFVSFLLRSFLGARNLEILLSASVILLLAFEFLFLSYLWQLGAVM